MRRSWRTCRIDPRMTTSHSTPASSSPHWRWSVKKASSSVSRLTVSEPNATTSSTPGGSLDHLIRPLEERLRNRQPERLGRLHVDHELELGGLLDGQVGWFGAFEDLAHIGGGASPMNGAARTAVTPGQNGRP